MVDMGDDAEISDIRDGHGQSVNIVERREGVNPVAKGGRIPSCHRRVGE
jgi:hypothetical protein